MTIEEMNKRIAELEQKVQQIMADANAGVGFCNGQIALLKELIATQTPPPAPAELRLRGGEIM